ISEFLVLVGTFTRHRTYAVLATVGIVFAALYILIMYQRVFHGPPSERASGWRDLSLRESLAVGPLLPPIIFLGIYPQPVLKVINAAVEATLTDMHQKDPAPTVTAETGGTR